MGKITGFMEFERLAESYRPVNERILDFDEIYGQHHTDHLRTQGARCMDCGVPFCQSEEGCPVYNLIPEWNDLVYRDDWRSALDRLHTTNNFPDFTGRVCPAPCEGACVLGITDPPVTIKNIEQAIADRGFEEGWIVPQVPLQRTGKQVAIVGSGPTALAAAAQLNSVGHHVSVFEREDRIGGLLMYGIPNMKLDKRVLVNRRVQLLKDEGIEFHVNVSVGDGVGSDIDAKDLIETNDAVLLATGATVPRDLLIPGREFHGIYFAMDYLTRSTKHLLDVDPQIEINLDAKDKHVVVIGGGDTGADCIGTAIRQGARTVRNFEIVNKPPVHRAPGNLWPTWPRVFRTDYAHEEAVEATGDDVRSYTISSTRFLGNSGGELTGIVTEDVVLEEGRFVPVPGSSKEWPCDLLLLAMGFLGPEHDVSDRIGVTYDNQSNYAASAGVFQTTVPGVFAAGDCRRGQSLVVRAINEGREAAREIDRFLMGSTVLP